MPTSLPLIIPVENQLRELDAKLLLAVCAANAGITSYLGYRTEIDINITKFPRSLYMAKSFTHRSDKMFRILSKLGHIICAWDEEALVHYPADIYFTRRLSPDALKYVSHIFAWGLENEELLHSYPELPKEMPIHKVGNPRLDMLRNELKPFYKEQIDRISQEHGDFILINTNFGNVNAHLPIHNLFIHDKKGSGFGTMTRGSAGMTREFAEGREKYKQLIFKKFTELIPYLASSLPETKFIIRPHPVENQNTYLDFATTFENVEVVREGNVIPWIYAARLLIHSGCTTGIEAYISKNDAIAYTPVSDDRYGYDAILPNALSHNYASADAVLTAIKTSTRNEIDDSILHHYLQFDEQRLCSTKIVDFIENIAIQGKSVNYPEYIHGWLLANKRGLIKKIKGLSKKSKYHQSFQEVRFPTLDAELLNRQANQFAELIGYETKIQLKQVSPHIFLVQ